MSQEAIFFFYFILFFPQPISVESSFVLEKPNIISLFDDDNKVCFNTLDLFIALFNQSKTKITWVSRIRFRPLLLLATIYA